MTSTIIFDPTRTHQTPLDNEQVVLRGRYGAEFTGAVQSESFSAIAVKIDGGMFNIGDSFQVEYGGAQMQAFVHRFDEQADGTWLVVLQWGSGGR
jgi:hypothetical protein